MKAIKEYKKSAWAALKGNWERAILTAFVMMLASVITNLMILCVDYIVQYMDIICYEKEWLCPILYISIVADGILVVVFGLLPLTVAFVNSFSHMYSGLERNPLQYLKKESFVSMLRTSAAMLLMGLVTSVCSLVLLVPGFIASLALFLVPYILKDNPDLTIMDTLRLSRKMMKGHKMQLFKLQLSFLGWIFLNVLTLGIGSLWLIPYMMTTLAAFYQDVKAEYLMKEARQESAL
jgi:uncharacterized membrane protein